MTVVRKKTPSTSSSDLQSALSQLIDLLETQKEDAAIVDLNSALHTLSHHEPASPEYQNALQLVKEAFEGEHELIAYTFRGEKNKEWSAAEELFLASSKVYNLLHRLLKA